MIFFALLILALFVAWAVRFGYPPPDVPQALCYHKLSDRFCFEGTWITPRNFIRQIDYLHDDGYRFIDEASFLAAIQHPDAGHAKELLLTFDDGYEQLHDVYLRELKPRCIPMLVFLVTEYAGKENDWDLSLGRRPFRHLTWEQVEEMSDGGADFGTHGATHRDLTRLDGEALAREIRGSKRAVEESTGRAVRSISYPFGRYNDAVKSKTQEAGYEAGFSLYPGHSNAKVDQFALRRNGVYIIDDTLSLRCKLKRNPLYWFEEMKCRTINGVAVLTPMFKRSSTGPDR